MKYERVYGCGLTKYYMVGGLVATNRTQAKKMMKEQSTIDKVVDSIVNVPPTTQTNRKKSVNFIKSLAK